MRKFKENDRVEVINNYHGHIKGTIKGVSPNYHVVTDEGNDILASESEMRYENLLDMQVDDCDYEESFDTDDYLTEMATVKGGFMSIKIAVYGSEGKYPHFHFYKGIAPEKGVPQNKISGGGCICIETANYFIHGRHTEKMNRKEIDSLIDFLKSPHKLLKQYTNWEYIISEWDQNNPEQKQLPIDLLIPEYRCDMGSIQER